MDDARDIAMRMAAAEHCHQVAVADILSSEVLSRGFVFSGERVPLVNPQRGIFKPRSMKKSRNQLTCTRSPPALTTPIRSQCGERQRQP
jgi:hypothetical protein